MTKNQLIRVCLLLSLIIGVRSGALAIHPVPPSHLTPGIHNHQNQNWYQKGKNELIKSFSKAFFKKAVKKETMRNLAIGSLVSGILGLILIFMIGVISNAWLFAFLLAIIGDILSIVVLVKTKKDKTDHKITRKLAWAGLAASLLTGLLPLSLFLLILLTI